MRFFDFFSGIGGFRLGMAIGDKDSTADDEEE